MKLVNKINLYTAVLFIGLLILMNLTIYYLFKNLMIESEITAAEQEINNITQGISTSLTKNPAIEDLLRAYVPVDGAMQIVLENGQRAAMITSPQEQILSNLDANFYPHEFNEPILIDKFHYYFHSLPIIWTDGTVANLHVVKSIQTPYNQLRILRIVLIAVTLIAMIPVIVSSRLLSKVIMLPITSMTLTMKEITKSGKFKRIQLENQSKDELSQMADTFNHMIDLLESNFTKQEQFISNASHELKTPLTVIESYSSLLKRRGLDKPEIFIESVEAIHSESIRMKEMTEQLLLLAKPLEKWNIEINKISPNDFIPETVKVFERAYHRKIEYQELEPITFRTDLQKIKQLVYIILENAVKYSDEKIVLSTGKENNDPFIRIVDRGIGIPQSEIPKIFDRFYRVDQTRSRKTGGTGLGLSIAKQIADALSIRLHIESAAGVGTSVTIFLSDNHD